MTSHPLSFSQCSFYCISCQYSWAVPPHFTHMCIHFHIGMPSSHARWLRFVPRHTYDSLVVDLRSVDFLFSCVYTRSNATHFNRPPYCPGRLYYHISQTGAVTAPLRDSDGRTLSLPLATLVDRNPRLGYGFRSEHLSLRKTVDMFVPAGLV